MNTQVLIKKGERHARKKTVSSANCAGQTGGGMWINTNIFVILPDVDRGFCPTESHSHSIPKKHTEVCIIYKLLAY